MKSKLIYIYPKKASFIINDIHFLEKKFLVFSQDLDWGSPKKLPFNLIKQCFFLLKNIKNTKAIIINFGGYFSLLPTLFGKIFNVKTFIIINGTDCVSFPNYNYGSLRKNILKFFIKKSYTFATKLLPVDDSLIFQEHSFDNKVIHKKQGIQAFFPTLKTSLKVIPNGFDTSFWKPNKTINKNGFITVAIVNNTNTFKAKGIDLIFKVATRFPNEKFTIIGISKEVIVNLPAVPKNIIIIPFLKKEALKKEYQKNTFYIQPSINEGFGCAVSEAMLCGCIPIVSNVGALPYLTNGTGFKIYKRDFKELATIIRKVTSLNNDEILSLSKKANERINKKFNISKRERLILAEIDK